MKRMLKRSREAEWVVKGNDPVQVGSDFRYIPVPGHTAGSMVILYKETYLFTGDHLWWDRERKSLDVPSVLVWDAERLSQSTKRLLDFSFEWVLPGHGERTRFSSKHMKIELEQLIKNLSVPPQKKSS